MNLNILFTSLSIKELKKVTLIILLQLLSLSVLMAQSGEEKDKVVVQAKVVNGKVKLRWATNTPVLWQQANRYGFSVERHTLISQGEFLERPEVRVLNQGPITPKALEEWEELVFESDYAAIAAQALYGEEIEINDAANPMVSIVNKAQELESRFSMALFAADQELRVAEYAGLYWEDATAKTDEKYLYRVYAHVPASIGEVDTAFVFVDMQEPTDLPAVYDIEAQEQDGMLVMKWNTAVFNHLYNAYYVEVSRDGKEYRPASDRPIVPIASEGPRKEAAAAYFVDSLAQEGDYYYRVKGKTIFDEMGPASDSVKVVYQKLSDLPQAYIENHEFLENGGLSIEWALIGEWLPGSQVELQRSEKATEGFRKIAEKDKIEPFTDYAPGRLGFYRLLYRDSKGRAVSSPVEMIRAIDSIPPAPPTGLSGNIDEEGRVTLTWERNSEDDVIGYRLYKANFASEEPSEITPHLIKDTLYRTAENLKTLNTELYYYVTAIDHVQNASALSEKLKLTKPLTVRPSPPFIREIRTGRDSLLFMLDKDSNPHIEKYLLYRKKLDEETFKLCAIADRDTDRLWDTDTGQQGRFQYLALSVTYNKLESAPSNMVEHEFMGARQALELPLRVERTGTGGLRIVLGVKQEGFLSVYRKEVHAGDDFRLIYNRGAKGEFIDENIQKGIVYAYKLMLEADGTNYVSRTIEIEF